MAVLSVPAKRVHQRLFSHDFGGLFNIATLAALFTTVRAAAQNTDSDLGSDNDFANNLFSDLAPILALFGERFAQQYLSYSTGILDCTIFALAPLGVLTAIVGAIRVEGPLALRSLIGRAREPQALAEMELQSSTSNEVCELWNGSSIVRVMGAPDIKQFLYFENIPRKDTEPSVEQGASSNSGEGMVRDPESVPPKNNNGTPITNEGMTSEKHFSGLFTLEQAEERGLICEHKDYIYQSFDKLKSFLLKFKKTAKSTAQVGGTLRTSRDKGDPAPNICLNLSPYVRQWELLLAILFGIVVQVGAVVLAGFTAYSPGRLNLGAGARNSYSFPLYAAGTVFLFLGMLGAASIIDRSTTEKRWKKVYGESQMYIIWIQYGKNINDQVFESHALFRKGHADYVCTSRRRSDSLDTDPDSQRAVSYPPQSISKTATVGPRQTDQNDAQSKWWSGAQLLTVVTTVISLVGFIAQFMGLRGMHSAASGAQLAALFFMTMVRAVLRRGISATPIAYPIKSGFELDWLATTIAHSDWNLGTEYANGWKSTELAETLFCVSTTTSRSETSGTNLAHVISNCNHCNKRIDTKLSAYYRCDISGASVYYCDSCFAYTTSKRKHPGHDFLRLKGPEFKCGNCKGPIETKLSYYSCTFRDCNMDYCDYCFVEAEFTHPGHRFQLVKELKATCSNEDPTDFSTKRYWKNTDQNFIDSSGRVCDGCSVQPIRGVRYRCAECYDFDFCETCFIDADIKHPGHTFISLYPYKYLRDPDIAETKSTEPPSIPGQQFYAEFSHGCWCPAGDGLHPIIGVLFRCSNCASSYCGSCFGTKDLQQHHFEHSVSLLFPFKRLEGPVPMEQENHGPESKDRESRIPVPVRIRSELAKLSGFPRGPVKTLSENLTLAIEKTLNSLCPVSEFLRHNTFSWSIEVHVGPNLEKLDFVAIKDERLGQWKLESGRHLLEAIMSLWWFSVVETVGQHEAAVHARLQGLTGGQVEKKALRIVGLKSDHLLRDLNWWMPKGGINKLQVFELAAPPPGPGSSDQSLLLKQNQIILASHRLFGNETLPTNTTSPQNPLLSIASTPSNPRAESLVLEFSSPVMDDDAQRSDEGPESLDPELQVLPEDAKHLWLGVIHSEVDFEFVLAQQILAIFIRAAATRAVSIRAGRDHTTVDSVRTQSLGLGTLDWRKLQLSNSVVTEVAQAIYNYGLTKTVEEGFLCIIPALSNAFKLPNEAVVDTLVESIETADMELNLDKSNQLNLILCQILSKPHSPECRFSRRATIAVIEYRCRLHAVLEDIGKDAKGVLETLLKNSESTMDSEIKKLLLHGNNIVLENLLILYSLQRGRDAGLLAEYAATLRQRTGSGSKNMLEGTSASGAAQTVQTEKGEDWTRLIGSKFALYLHRQCEYLSAKQLGNHWSHDLIRIYKSDVNGQDVTGWTPLHYLASKIAALVGPEVEETPKPPDQQARETDAAPNSKDGKGKELESPQEASASSSSRLKTARTEETLLEFLSCIQLLMEAGANPSQVDAAGQTVLHIIAKSRVCRVSEMAGASIVAALIKNGDPGLQAHDGATPVHFAARHDPFMLRLFLQKSKDSVSKRDRLKRTPLHWAVAESSGESVRILLDTGLARSADLDIFDLTPLHLAVARTNPDAVKYLAETNALEVEDGKRRTAVHKSIVKITDDMQTTSAYGSIQDSNTSKQRLHLQPAIRILKNLLKANPRLAHTDKKGRNVLHYAFLLPSACQKVVRSILKKTSGNRQMLLSTPDSEGLTPFMIAIRKQEDLNVLKWLLVDYSSDLLDGAVLRDKAGENILHSFLANSKLTLQVDAVGILEELVTKFGRGSDALKEVSNKANQSPLHVCCKQPASQNLNILLQKLLSYPNCVSTLSLRDTAGQTALHICCQKLNYDALTVILEAMKDETNTTPLGTSQEKSRSREGSSKNSRPSTSVKDIINMQDNESKTPLVLAIEAPVPVLADPDAQDGSNVVKEKDRDPNLRIIELLLKYGANIDQSMGALLDSSTALHRAVMTNRVDIIGLLIQHNANTLQADSHNRIPLHYAALLGFTKAIDTLLLDEPFQPTYNSAAPELVASDKVASGDLSGPASTKSDTSGVEGAPEPVVSTITTIPDPEACSTVCVEVSEPKGSSAILYQEGRDSGLSSVLIAEEREPTTTIVEPQAHDMSQQDRGNPCSNIVPQSDASKSNRIKKQLLTSDEDGRSPLTLACLKWQAKEDDSTHNGSLLPVIHKLVQAGADPLQKDTFNSTTLMLFCANTELKHLGKDEHLRILRTLIEDHKVDANHINADNRTALHLAAYNSQIAPVLCYLLGKMDIKLTSARDTLGYSPFEYAVQNAQTTGTDETELYANVEALSDPGSLFRRDSFGALHIAPCASDSNRMSDKVFEAILQSIGFDGKSEDIIRDYSEGLSTLAQLFVHCEQKVKLGHLEKYLTSRRYAKFLTSAQDEHGWTVEMCQRERSRVSDTSSESYEETTAKPPNEWSQIFKHPNLQVEGCTLKSIRKNDTNFHDYDHRAKFVALANNPFPASAASRPEIGTITAGSTRSLARYFEVNFVRDDLNELVVINVGLVNHFTNRYQAYLGLGVEGSWAIHNDDGKIFGQHYGRDGYSSSRVEWPPTEDGNTYREYGRMNDVIGCGIDQQGRIFFTKNGTKLRIRDADNRNFTGIRGKLFPAVSVGEGVELKANFGPPSTFRYQPAKESKELGDGPANTTQNITDPGLGSSSAS